MKKYLIKLFTLGLLFTTFHMGGAELVQAQDKSVDKVMYRAVDPGGH